MTVENVKKAIQLCGDKLFTIQTTSNSNFFKARIKEITYDGDLVIIEDINGQKFYVDATDINIISTTA